MILLFKMKDPYLNPYLIDNFNSANLEGKVQILNRISKWFIQKNFSSLFNQSKMINNWPIVKKIKLKNCSQELTDFLNGQRIGRELGFIANFKSNINGEYILYLNQEGYGNYYCIDIEKLLKNSDKLKENEGFGHTHPTGSKINLFGISDICYLEGKDIFYPHILLTQNNGLFYLPLKGFFYLNKKQIKIINTNKQKK